jgi:hypothetical protein
MLKRLATLGSQFGIDPAKAARTTSRLPRYLLESWRYARAARGTEFPISLRALFPALANYDTPAGSTSGHYFHQDLWAARKIFERRPEEHLDLGSRIDGFVTHLLTFMPVTVIDIRSVESSVPGLHFIQSDGADLGSIPDDSIRSLSSLHAVEHFGLGRYGDPIDPDAWRRATQALSRILHPDGRLYFSVPVGRERVQFNAHRIFSPDTILDAFSNLDLLSFAAVDDSGAFLPDVRPSDLRNARFACGLFEFGKR